MTKGTPNGGINGTLANGLLAHWCFTNRSLTDISENKKILINNTTFKTNKNKNSNYTLLKTNQITNLTTIVNLQKDLYPQKKSLYTPTNSYTIDYKGGA